MKRASVTAEQLKEQYNQHKKQQEMMKANEHGVFMEEELRRFRRDQLVQRQLLERHLLIEARITFNLILVFICSLGERFVLYHAHAH